VGREDAERAIRNLNGARPVWDGAPSTRAARQRGRTVSVELGASGRTASLAPASDLTLPAHSRPLPPGYGYDNLILRVEYAAPRADRG
jgi:hypothetical protein